jgi:hypothetical protein
MLQRLDWDETPARGYAARPNWLARDMKDCSWQGIRMAEGTETLQLTVGDAQVEVEVSPDATLADMLHQAGG